MINNATTTLIASLIDQSKSRLDVVLQYVNQNNDLIIDSEVTSKMVELRKVMLQLESISSKIWDDDIGY